MDNDKLMKVYFNDDVLIIDVNDDWTNILNKKHKILKIETTEWEWNLLTGEVILFQ